MHAKQRIFSSNQLQGKRIDQSEVSLRAKQVKCPNLKHSRLQAKNVKIENSNSVLQIQKFGKTRNHGSE